jgi:hypothetical protein
MPLLGFARSLPFTGKRQAMCVRLRVLRVLGLPRHCEGLLYRSKPSIEATNVNADTPECQPGPSGPCAPDALPLWRPVRALPH